MILIMLVALIELTNLSDFGGGQRSSGVTRGQTLKMFKPMYLQNGNSDSYDTWHVSSGSPNCVEKSY